MYLIILYCLVIVLQMYNVMKQISTKIIIKKAFNQHDFFHQSILTWAFYFLFYEEHLPLQQHNNVLVV